MITVFLCRPGSVGAGTWEELAKLTASDAAADDRFGVRVAVSGDTVVVGAFFDDDAGSSSGSAYVFEPNAGGVWEEVAKLTASDAAAGDRFGGSVAISGDTVVVGANGNDDLGSSSGSAYVFELNAGGVWEEVAKLTASDAAAGDRFGDAVAISGDTVVVSAPLNGDAGSASGSVYVFERDEGGLGAWGQVAKLTAGDAAAGDEFGRSVAISGDTAVVGAPLDDDAGSASGSVYVFERDEGGPGAWGQVAKLTASDAAASDNFGRSVDIGDDTAVVGASQNDDVGENSGSAYVFGRNVGGDNHWGQVVKLAATDAAAGDQFGESAAISINTIVVGAHRNSDAGSDSGSAYVFLRDEGGSDNWGQVTKLTANDAAAGDEFGLRVAISGNTIVAGSRLDDDDGSSSGSVYVFGMVQSLAQFACFEATRLYTRGRFTYKKFGRITHATASNRGIRPNRFCSPAEVRPVGEGGEGGTNPAGHLTCYEKKHWKHYEHFRWWKYKKHHGHQRHRHGSDKQELYINNMFGNQTLRVATIPHTLCLPSGKGEESIIPVDLDRFKCFAAKKVQGPPLENRKVTVDDGTESKDGKIVKPVAFCIPVDIQNQEIQDAMDYLTCYKFRMRRSHELRYSRYRKWGHWKHRFPSERITVNNDFGAGQKLRVFALDTVCVPSVLLEHEAVSAETLKHDDDKQADNDDKQKGRKDHRDDD